MPLKRLNFSPGIDTTLTPTANSGGWTASNLVRWREGRVEPLGGWAHITNQQPAGVCRALHYWTDLTGTPRIGFGTNQRLYYEQDGNILDITPSGMVAGKISSGNAPYSLLVFSLDNFGQVLLAMPSGQSLFAWTPGSPGAAVPVTTAPAVNQGMFVLQPQRIVMAYGCTPVSGGVANPLLVRWSDQEDYTVWVAATTNQAGSFPLSRGNRIVGGLQVPGYAMLWTDLDAWMVQYIGYPLIFSFTQAGSNCGLIAQKAACVLGGVPYWMSDHGFFRMGAGGPEQLPCPVWDIVFKDLDVANQDKCLAATNYHYSEVCFFFPSLSGGTGEIDSYVKVNIQEGEWDYGSYSEPGIPNPLARTAWTDQNQPGDPISVDLRGILQQQESGLTMDGSGAVPASIRSGFLDIAEGEQIMVMDQFVPDFKWGSADAALDLTMYFRNWPGDTPTKLGPFRVTPTTEQITLRLPTQLAVGGTNVTSYPAPRCREVALQIDNAKGWWRLGSPRARVFDAGRL